MKTTFKIDSRQFNAFINDLTKMVGASREVVLDRETEKVLSRAVKYTRKASIKQIVVNANKKAARKYKNYSEAGPGDQAVQHPPYISVTSKASWLVVQARNGDQRFLKMDKPGGMGDARYNRFLKLNDAREGAMKSEIRKLIEEAKKARGLSAQEWVTIGRALGLKVVAPGYVVAATTGRRYNSAIGRRGKSGGVAYVEIGSTMRLLAEDLGGAGILERAMKAGVTAFKKDIENQVFNDAKRLAARYPGITVR